MKKVISTILLLCFLVASIGITAIAEEVASYDTYTLSGTFTGAAEGDLISVFVLKEGYTMEDIGSSTGSVMDKVYYTNMFSAGEGGAYSFDITIPEGTSRSSECVLVCNGVKQQDTLRSFLVSSGSLQVIYASPSGSTGANGTKEKPYTLSKAKDTAITKAKNSDVDILLYDGKYNYEDNRIQFTSANQGTGHRITFTPASKDDKPVVTSMKSVNHQYITKVTDGDVLARIPESSRGMIYKLDMDAAGFADNEGILAKDDDGNWYHTGSTYSVLTMGYSTSSNSIEPPILYLNGKRQRMSQYPNEGTVAFDNAVDVVGKDSNGYSTLTYYKKAILSSPSIDFTDTMDFAKWENAIDDAFLVGFLFNSFRGAAAKITKIEESGTLTKTKKITLDTTNSLYYPNPTWNPRFGPRVAIVNLPEEMDIPGEYYFDTQNKDIYYYAPYELTADDVFEMANDRGNQYNSTLGGYSYVYPQLVHITSSENITFDGIEFYGGRFDNAIYVSGSSKGIEFKNCTVHGCSESGMSVSGTDTVISNCNIYDVGRGGIVTSASAIVNKDISTPSGPIIENCHIYNYGQNPTFSVYTQGIVLNNSSDTTNEDGSINVTSPFGAVIQNNLIHASKFGGAVRYSGINTTVKRNEMYNVLDSMDDLGVVYIGRRVNEFRNSLTENYIHHFSSTANPRYNVMGIYWDDYQSGQDATRNIVVGTDKTDDTFLGIRTIGYNNVIKNNIFVDLNIGVGLSGRSASDSAATIKEEGFMNDLTNRLPVPEYEYYQQMVDFREVLEENAYQDLDGDGEIDVQMVHMAKAQNNVTVDCENEIATTTSENRIYQYGSENVYGNVAADKSIFVDPANHDYRVKEEAITDGALSEVPNELDFDMDWIGIQTKDKMPDADQSFKLMHPTKGENLTKDNVILTWEKALFADKYEYVIATDSSFAESSIVESGETKEDFVIPTATFTEGTTYYWKVKAVNFSNNMGSEWNCDEIQSFTVAKAVDFEIIESTVLSEDGATILGTLEGVQNFDFSYKVKNNGTSSQEFVVIAALFSDEGKFQQAKISEEGASLASGETTSGTFEFTPSFTMKDGYYVKVFVVDTPKRIDPLSFFGTALKKQ